MHLLGEISVGAVGIREYVRSGTSGRLREGVRLFSESDGSGLPQVPWTEPDALAGSTGLCEGNEFLKEIEDAIDEVDVHL
jgi:hypothetical protein